MELVGAFLHLPVVPRSPTALGYRHTSHSKAWAELQSVRTEPEPAVHPPAALIPLLDRFPASNAAPARFWFQDVLLQTHVLLLFPQAAGRRSGGPGPGRLRWTCSATGWGCGPADRNVGNSIPAGTSGLKKASILPGHTPEHRQHLQAPSSTSQLTPSRGAGVSPAVARSSSPALSIHLLSAVVTFISRCWSVKAAA